MTTAYSDRLKQALAKAPAHTTADALEVLSALSDAVPASDGIGAFTRLYRAVTAEVRASLSATTFHDRAWMDRLDAIFANLYFHALSLYLDGSYKTPRAWRPLFATRSQPKAALQFAIAGMNAHINRDLPVALVTVCRETGVELCRPSRQHDDYLAINPILAKVQDHIKSQFLVGELAVADHLLGKLDDVVANFSIVEARAAAWSQGEVLWAVRDNAHLSEHFLDALDGIVGLAGRGLLVTL